MPNLKKYVKKKKLRSIFVNTNTQRMIYLTVKIISLKAINPKNCFGICLYKDS